jgi:hypothetical protein
MMSGLAVFGGIGWLLDGWLDSHFWTPIGLIFGMSLGIYAVVMRFGRPEAVEATPASAEKSDMATALRAAKVANRQKAFTRARAVAAQMTASSPADGQPSTGTRRETECP